MLKDFILREADPGDADPQGGSSGKPEKVRASDLRAQLGSQVDEQGLMRFLEKHADVLNDNWSLRAKNTSLRTELTDLKAKATPEGARVLTPDEAQVYDAYTALGLKPEDVKRAIDEGATAKGDLSTLRRNETLRGAAEAHGYKAAALAKLPSLKDQDITLKEDSITENGKPVKRVRAFVGDKALPDYIQEHDAEFLPALTADVAKPAGDGVGSPANGRKPAAVDTLTMQPRAII